ncbi:MAG: c-type cytochrome [Alphaproteobacteria bacterium]
MKHVTGLMTAFIIAFGFSPVQGSEDVRNLAAKGKMLAETYCARCHAVDRDDKSTLPIAPPLRTFASKWPLESLEEAFAEGIITGHPGMPVFQLEPDQIAALMEHLHEISEKNPAKAQ